METLCGTDGKLSLWPANGCYLSFSYLVVIVESAAADSITPVKVLNLLFIALMVFRCVDTSSSFYYS